ncbi:MAG: retroviral-like aspartic protease family protein [Oscillospiraceae bacterium]|jgi:clan AA aspartic protease (TIGR02281 family)|nr:retroviral-like aspartic protease family protein [Oscillospiraceae bacterium]
MTVYFDDSNYIQIQRQGGHHYITIRAVYTGSDVGGTDVDFILDTGAFMTVISRDIAKEFGYDKLPKVSAKIKGYSGEVSADFVRIPGLKVLEPLLTDVPVLIPHSNEHKLNVLGLNVLEYFNYYFDTENDKLYLCNNPNPRPYREILACGGVFIITDKNVTP